MDLSSRMQRLVAPSPRAWVDWEEVDCPLCEGSRWEPFTEAPDAGSGASGLWFAVVRCLDCGSYFTNPRPTLASLARFQHAARRAKRRRSRSRRSHRLPWRRGERDSLRLPWHGQGRLLDVGCRDGSFLHRMHREGWQVTGLDGSAEAVDRIRTERGLPAWVGTLPHPRLAAASFDTLTVGHTLGHAADPLDLLREAHVLLVPGGQIVVGVPNLESLSFRWFQRSWVALNLPRHLTHFTPESLTWMVERAGFRVMAPWGQGHSKWFRLSARRARKRPTESAAWTRWLTVKSASRLAAWIGVLAGRPDSIWLTAEKVV